MKRRGTKSKLIYTYHPNQECKENFDLHLIFFFVGILFRSFSLLLYWPDLFFLDSLFFDF